MLRKFSPLCCMNVGYGLDDFMGALLSAQNWASRSSGGASTIAMMSTVAGGAVSIASGATSGSSVEIYRRVFHLAVANKPYFSCRARVNNRQNTKVELGIAANSPNQATQGVWFYFNDTAGNDGYWHIGCFNGGTSTTAITSVATADNTWTTLELMADPNGASFLINGSPVGAITTNLTSSYLSSLLRVTTNTSAARILEVDWTETYSER